MKRGLLLVLGLAVIVAVATGLLAQGPPPDPRPGATQPVRERNLDADGFIAVHEQGVAQVDVTNSSLTVEGTVDVNQIHNTVDVNVEGGTVDVGNFPDTQDVNVVGLPTTSVTHVIHFLAADEPDDAPSVPTDYWFNGVMHTTLITLNNQDDEREILFWTPLDPNNPVKIIFDFEGGTVTHQSIPLFHPIPISGVRVNCFNEQFRCREHVTFWGYFEPE